MTHRTQLQSLGWGLMTIFYEILAIRILSTHLGDAISIQAATVSAFLLGLALGALSAHKVRNKLAGLTLLLSLWSGLFPLMVAELSYQLAPLSRTLSAILVIILVLPPSWVMGLGIPLLARRLDPDSHNLKFGKIYLGANLGGVVGLLMAEFWAIRFLGLQGSLMLLAGICALLGLSLFGKIGLTESGLTPVSLPTRFQFSIFCLSVAAAIFQAFFMRACFYLFFPHRENFALGLLVVLAGIILGTEMSRRRGWDLGFCALGAAYGTVWLLLCYGPVSGLFLRLSASLKGEPFLLPALKFAIAVLLGILAFTFFGASLVSALTKESVVDRESGRVLWLSGIGNFVGYLGYTFVLHQWLTQGVVLCLVALLATTSWVLASPTKHLGWLPVALALGCGLWTWSEQTYYLPGGSHTSTTTTFKSGPDSASLTTANQKTTLSYNGHHSIVVKKEGRLNVGELLVGLTPALYSRDHKRALVIGLGTGLTAWATSEVYQKTDVVELNLAMRSVCQVLSPLNREVLKRDDVSFQWNDARQTIPKKPTYDAIICTTGDATYYSTSKLHSVEFYRQLNGSLKPGGVFCLWLSREYSGAGMEIVLTTLNKVFTHCRLRILGRGYYLLIASNEPVSPRTVEKLNVSPEVLQEISNTLPSLSPQVLLNESELSSNLFAQPLPFSAPVNTDDHPALEFAAVSHHRRAARGWNPLLEYQAELNIDPTGVGLSPLRQKQRQQLHRQLKSRFLPAFRYGVENKG